MTTESVFSASGFDSSLSGAEPSDLPRYRLGQRLRSGYYALWYRLGEHLHWSRGVYCEQPVGRLVLLSRGQQTQITLLRRRFDLRFEKHCAALTSLKSSDFLNMLDQAWIA